MGMIRLMDAGSLIERERKRFIAVRQCMINHCLLLLFPTIRVQGPCK